MKLSEAIRLGAMLHRQGFQRMHTAIELITGDMVIVTCALGAAVDAGYRLTAAELNTHAVCPGCAVGSTLSSVAGTIAHLNDFHCWSRERIADWVETIESQQAGEAERQQALTITSDRPRGTTACEQPVLATRA